MPLDKSWIDCGTRCSVSYFAKIDEFLDFAYANKDVSSTIYCPCRKCRNRILLGRSIVRQHLRLNGFWVRYKIWTKHGEPFTGFEEPAEMDEVLPDSENYMDVEMTRLVEDAIGTTNVPISDDDNDITESENATPGPTESTREFLKLMQNANLPLYPGSKKHTTLSFAVRLLQAKSLHGWTDTSFKELLDIFSEVMPEGVNLPKTYYQAEKLVEDLGFTFKTVDACPNDCMLFRNENEGLDECLICKASRWRKVSGTFDESGTRRAAKQARYFPLIPRLQRLFATAHSANLMKWHGEKRVDDGVFRHPADSPAWKHLDTRHASFAADIRNVRLGIASDGFNPFRNQNLKHSTWPVVIIPYNLPPMLILKQPYIYLSVLIDGPKGPGDKIDVYLEPLIEELNESWEVGVETYDASTNQMFQMRAALLWSINDFPAYANISGWSTKGEYGCPKCNTSPGSKWLKNGHKWSYGKSRRFTPLNHPYRRDAKSFYTGRDFDEPPPRMTGAQHLLQLQSNRVLTQYKKEDMILRHNMGHEKEEKDPSKKKKHNWKKKSILYELPYWVDNLLPYSIDAMHVEKNVAENVISTILGVKGKSKDNLASRRDLEDLGIRKQYHVKVRESGVEFFERAEYEMDNDGKDKFLLSLSKSRMPDGSCSSIARRVNLKDRSIGGLKSHDYHILLQQLIPLCVRSSLPKKVVSGLIDLGKFFKVLCSKTNSAADLEKAKTDIILTLCDLEKIFPPSFFDVMEHLPIHLAEEALIGGAVQYRWMYPIERFLLTLKNYVRQNACPEASIAKGYLMEECMNFCSQYLKDVESKKNRPPRRKDDDDKKGKSFIMTEVTRIQIHRWVLFHTDAITPYLNEHLITIKQLNPNASEELVATTHFNEFPNWFRTHVQSLQEDENVSLSDEVLALSSPPSPSATKLTSYTSNGYFFRVKSVDNKRTRQNCGVCVEGDRLPYYGRLTDIIKVMYSSDIKYVLFKCEWAHPSSGVKLDPFNFTLVNFRNLLYQNDQVRDEPFILESQARQVWYNQDPSGQGWLNVGIVESKEYSHVNAESDDLPNDEGLDGDDELHGEDDFDDDDSLDNLAGD